MEEMNQSSSPERMQWGYSTPYKRQHVPIDFLLSFILPRSLAVLALSLQSFLTRFYTVHSFLLLQHCHSLKPK